jgi:O-antigen/teichoic acid export membrane protein
MSTSLARGALLGLLTVVVERGLSFGVLLLLARGLGAEHFGVFVYVLAGLMPIQVMADQGIEVAAVKMMAARPRSRADVLTLVLALRGAVWVFVAVPVAVWVLPAWGGCAVSTALAGSLVALVGPSLPYRSLYRAREDMARVWLIATSDAALGACAVLAALWLGAGVAGLLVARALASLVVTGAVAATANVRIGQRRLRRRTVATLVEGAWPLALNALLLTLMVRLGQLVAMRILDAEAVGRLGAASRIAEIISLIPEGVMMAVFPAMAARRIKVAALARDTSGQLGALILWVVVVCAAGAVPIMRTLFGEAYVAGGAALRILCWSGLTSATGSVALYRLISADRQRLLLLTNAGAAAVGVALQALLIPAGGIEGAALATVATLATGQILLLFDPAGRAAVLDAWRAVAQPLLVAIGVLVAVWAVPDPVASAGAAAVLFPVGAWLAGIVDRAALVEMAAALRGGLR